MGRVLLVEDDVAIAEPLARTLRREGHEVDVCGQGAPAVDAAASADVVILDLGLPDVDGLEVCRRIRQRLDVPILMLTARADEIDKVVGLDAGADDYLAKPFGVAELLARVRALLRRAGDAAAGASEAAAVVEAQEVRVDAAARRAWVGADELDLTPKEFDLLALLVAEAGTVVRREEIIDQVWDPHWYGPTKTLDMHISWLRRKLGDDPARPRYITTVRGVGYRFERDAP